MDGTVGARCGRESPCSCHQLKSWGWGRSFALEVKKSGTPQGPEPAAQRVPGLGPHSSSKLSHWFKGKEAEKCKKQNAEFKYRVQGELMRRWSLRSDFSAWDWSLKQHTKFYAVPKVTNGHCKNIHSTWNCIRWCRKAKQPAPHLWNHPSSQRERCGDSFS